MTRGPGGARFFGSHLRWGRPTGECHQPTGSAALAHGCRGLHRTGQLSCRPRPSDWRSPRDRFRPSGKPVQLAVSRNSMSRNRHVPVRSTGCCPDAVFSANLSSSRFVQDMRRHVAVQRASQRHSEPAHSARGALLVFVRDRSHVISRRTEVCAREWPEGCVCYRRRRPGLTRRFHFVSTGGSCWDAETGSNKTATGWRLWALADRTMWARSERCQRLSAGSGSCLSMQRTDAAWRRSSALMVETTDESRRTRRAARAPSRRQEDHSRCRRRLRTAGRLCARPPAW